MRVVKKYAPFLVLIAFAALISGCSTGNHFASSFGKRRYMNGYYNNFSDGDMAVAPVQKKPKAVNVQIPGIKAGTVPVNQNNMAVVRAKQNVNREAIKKTAHVKAAAISPVAASSKRTVLFAKKITDGQTSGYTPPQQVGMSDWAQALLIALFTLLLTAALVFLLVAVASQAPVFAIVALAILFVVSIIGIFYVASLPTDHTRSYDVVNSVLPLADIFVNLFFAIISAASR